MPINTRIDGDPATVFSAADWIRNPLASGITHTADQVYAARNRADAGWHGGASEAFRDMMTRGAASVDDFGDSANEMAGRFDNVAAELQRAQREMQRIRDAAAAAGLTVTSAAIQEPGPAPPDAGPAPAGSAATPEAVQAHADAMAVQRTHAAQVRAYNAAQTDADDVRAAWNARVREITNTANRVGQKAWFTVGDLASGVGATAAAKHTSTLAKHADFLDDQAKRLISHAKAIGATSPAGFYQNLDAADDAARAARQTTDDAARTASKARWTGIKLGGVLAAGGIIYDISQGKPAGQAIVSGAAGFGASLATGAAIGSFGGPVGTAVGAVIGAGVGIFTSGMVDSLWENGLDSAGQAIEDGWHAVTGTAEAIGSGAANAAEWVADGVEGAWDALF